jgi:hypothetical protein
VINPATKDGPQLVGPALRTFFNIADQWSLTDCEAARVLGLHDIATLVAWKETARGGSRVSLPPGAIERISHVLSIYRALQTLVPGPGRAARWLRAQNKASLFAGGPALKRITSGNINDLLAVRQYLDAQLV